MAPISQIDQSLELVSRGTNPRYDLLMVRMFAASMRLRGAKPALIGMWWQRWADRHDWSI